MDTFQIMTFNIRYGQADDGPQRWEARRELVIERIRAADPDLLALQECRDDAQAAYVRDALPDYDFYGVPRGGDGPTALEMAPILARRATLEIVRRGCFWLSDTPELPGSVGWDAMFPRTAAWVELRHRPTGGALAFLNTHFDLLPQAIVDSARLLRGWAERTAARLPLIICGDFNADKASAAYEMLADGHTLADAWGQANPPGADETTFHGFGQPGVATAIDWVLVSPALAVAAATIDRTQRAGLYPSDHFPVVVTLRLPVAP